MTDLRRESDISFAPFDKNVQMVRGGGRGRYPAASRNYFHAAVESWMERRTVLYSNLTKARHIPPSTVESDAVVRPPMKR